MLHPVCSKIGDNDDIADADVSIAVNANVEGVRRGDKAPEVLEGELLDVDAQTDLGMLYVRVSINASLFSSFTHSCFTSQKQISANVGEYKHTCRTLFEKRT
jgi:hypothetical protein